TAAQIEAALGSASATDNCDGTLTPGYSDGAVSSNGCLRSQTRTWNVSDACGNAATAVSRTATWKEDTTAPSVSCPADITVNADPTTCCAVVTFNVTATDNCDPHPT